MKIQTKNTIAGVMMAGLIAAGAFTGTIAASTKSAEAVTVCIYKNPVTDKFVYKRNFLGGFGCKGEVKRGVTKEAWKKARAMR